VISDIKHSLFTLVFIVLSYPVYLCAVKKRKFRGSAYFFRSPSQLKVMVSCDVLCKGSSFARKRLPSVVAA
jgi:hypothetical protein